MPSTLRLEVKEKQTRNQCCKRTHAPKDKVWAVRPIRTSDKIRSKCLWRHWNETWKDRKGKEQPFGRILYPSVFICIQYPWVLLSLSFEGTSLDFQRIIWPHVFITLPDSAFLLHVFCMSSECFVLCHTGLYPSIEPSVHGVGPSLRVKLCHEHLGLSLNMRNLHRLSKVHSNSSQRQQIFCSIRLKEQKAWRNLKNSVLSFDIR